MEDSISPYIAPSGFFLTLRNLRSLGCADEIALSNAADRSSGAGGTAFVNASKEIGCPLGFQLSISQLLLNFATLDRPQQFSDLVAIIVFIAF